MPTITTIRLVRTSEEVKFDPHSTNTLADTLHEIMLSAAIDGEELQSIELGLTEADWATFKSMNSLAIESAQDERKRNQEQERGTPAFAVPSAPKLKVPGRAN